MERSEIREPTCRAAMSSPHSASPCGLRFASEKIEIFVLLPFRRLVGLREAVLLEPGLVAAQFVALELEVVVDEYSAEVPAKERVAFERVERGRKTRREEWAVGRVGLFALRAGVELLREAIQPGGDLRGDVE